MEWPHSQALLSWSGLIPRPSFHGVASFPGPPFMEWRHSQALLSWRAWHAVVLTRFYLDDLQRHLLPCLYYFSLQKGREVIRACHTHLWKLHPTVEFLLSRGGGGGGGGGAGPQFYKSQYRILSTEMGVSPHCSMQLRGLASMAEPKKFFHTSEWTILSLQKKKQPV